MLEERYEMRIPANAIFISGHYDNEFQDSSIYITFKIPENEFKNLLINNWQPGGFGDEEQKKYSSSFLYQKEQFTRLACYNVRDGYEIIDFIGRHPGKPVN